MFHKWFLWFHRRPPRGGGTDLAYMGRRALRRHRLYDINQINADGILPSFRIMQQNVAGGCQPDGSGCAKGQAVPIVASGALTSAFVNSATTKTDLSQNGAGNFAGRVEQTTLALHLRPNQQFSAINYLDSGGDSYYHALQATVRKRFEAGLLLGAAYTFSKSIDDQSIDPVGSSSGGGLSTTNSRTPADTRTWRNERALSDFNRFHTFTATGVYELPFGRGKWIGGWSINGLMTGMGGEPFSVRSGGFTSNASHQSLADLFCPQQSTDRKCAPP